MERKRRFEWKAVLVATVELSPQFVFPVKTLDSSQQPHHCHVTYIPFQRPTWSLGEKCANYCLLTLTNDEIRRMKTNSFVDYLNYWLKIKTRIQDKTSENSFKVPFASIHSLWFIQRKWLSNRFTLATFWNGTSPQWVCMGGFGGGGESSLKEFDYLQPWKSS